MMEVALKKDYLICEENCGRRNCDLYLDDQQARSHKEAHRKQT